MMVNLNKMKKRLSNGLDKDKYQLGIGLSTGLKNMV